jgi:hypothetical protein
MWSLTKCHNIMYQKKCTEQQQLKLANLFELMSYV